MNAQPYRSAPALVAIHVYEVLDAEWDEWFAPLALSYPESGGTLFEGPVDDQCALYGWLNKVHNLNLTLIQVWVRPAAQQDAATD